jgi:alkanesulfonate monooxygenase SsuD/methylene tetrahydromethanopterin reductase-like flavin-dependent oxidoreductase (luciferase family)
MAPAAAEATTPRRGVWLFPGVSAGALVDAVVAAEALGLDEVWIADEGVSRDPVPVLAAAAIRTSRVRLATGITSPVLRHPGAIAASIATVDELSGGRAVLGLGVGGHLSLGPLGLGADRPVALLRDTIGIVRDVHGGIASDAYTPPRHAMPPRSVPIWVGARGPQLVRLAARVADGLFLSGCTLAEHESITANAATVGPIATAIYQSAVDRPSTETELDWDAAHRVLSDAIVRFAPDAIGVNLVQLAVDGTDPIPYVERAAALLTGL